MQVFILNKIAVLIGHSLLAQGIIANLRQLNPSLDLEVIDIESDNVLVKLKTVQPQVLILDSSQQSYTNPSSLSNFFSSIPNLIILEVSPDNSSVQLIRSDHYEISGFVELLHVLENTQANQSVFRI